MNPIWIQHVLNPIWFQHVRTCWELHIGLHLHKPYDDNMTKQCKNDSSTVVVFKSCFISQLRACLAAAKFKPHHTRKQWCNLVFGLLRPPENIKIPNGSKFKWIGLSFNSIYIYVCVFSNNYEYSRWCCLLGSVVKPWVNDLQVILHAARQCRCPPNGQAWARCSPMGSDSYHGISWSWLRNVENKITNIFVEIWDSEPDMCSPVDGFM